MVVEGSGACGPGRMPHVRHCRAFWRWHSRLSGFLSRRLCVSWGYLCLLIRAPVVRQSGVSLAQACIWSGAHPCVRLALAGPEPPDVVCTDGFACPSEVRPPCPGPSRGPRVAQQGVSGCVHSYTSSGFNNKTLIVSISQQPAARCLPEKASAFP